MQILSAYALSGGFEHSIDGGCGWGVWWPPQKPGPDTSKHSPNSSLSFSLSRVRERYFCASQMGDISESVYFRLPCKEWGGARVGQRYPTTTTTAAAAEQAVCSQGSAGRGFRFDAQVPIVTITRYLVGEASIESRGGERPPGTNTSSPVRQKGERRGSPGRDHQEGRLERSDYHPLVIAAGASKYSLTL